MNFYMYFLILLYIIAILLLVIGFSGIKKLEKEHSKITDSEYLLEHEKPIQKRNINLVIAGLVLLVIGSISSSILGFFK